MTKVLVITVGGSCEPIVNAVKSKDYDRVFFVCSTGGRQGSDQTVDGKGNPCRKSLEDRVGEPSIVVQAGLDVTKYEKILLEQDELDDLNLAYKRIKRLGKEITNKYPDAEIIANFTGGTKTMSACLVMAAIVYDWKLELNQGLRRDLIRVTSGDIAVPVSVEGILEDRYISLVEKALDAHDYSMAAAISTEFIKKITDAKIRAKWLLLKNLSEGFSLWDAFLYNEALPLLEAEPKVIVSWLATLRNLTYTEKQGHEYQVIYDLINKVKRKDHRGKCEAAVSRLCEATALLAQTKLTKRREHGYQVVYDLINNAERRAHQGRYDDAVSRLYRATELLAQTRLRELYDVESGSLSMDKIKQIFPAHTPESIFTKYEKLQDNNGRIKLGLRETYRLLSMLGDPIGTLFTDNEMK